MHTLEVSEYSDVFWLINLNFYVYVGGTAYGNAHFGTGEGPIFLDDVQCSSASSQLLECSSRPILTHNCRHSDDAGVGCEGIIRSMIWI